MMYKVKSKPGVYVCMATGRLIIDEEGDERLQHAANASPAFIIIIRLPIPANDRIHVSAFCMRVCEKHDPLLVSSINRDDWVVFPGP